MDLQSVIWSSTGSGGSQQLSMLLTHFLADSVQRVLISTGVLSWDTLLPQLAATLDGARRAARGEVVAVPALVGFTGLRLADRAGLTVGSGKLRQPRPVDRAMFLPRDVAITVVLETTFPLRYLPVSEWIPEADPRQGEDVYSALRPQMEEAFRSFQQKLDLIRLALLLGSSEAKPLLALEVSRVVLDPVRLNGPSVWMGSPSTAPSFEAEVREQREVAAWHALIVEKHSASLDVGVRRLLAATSTRTDANDAFIDAVICWENVLGTMTETTFRVTGALAKLLEPHHLQQRQDLQRELKKLYEERSKLVHGSKEPNVQESWDLKERAVQLATDLLRAIYRRRPDLIPLKSADRSSQLLLE